MCVLTVEKRRFWRSEEAQGLEHRAYMNYCCGNSKRRIKEDTRSALAGPEIRILIGKFELPLNPGKGGVRIL